MEWLVAVAIGLFFVGLASYGVLSRYLFDFFVKGPIADLGEAAQFEEFSWGKAWVYDTDRGRRLSDKPILFIHGLGGSIYSWRFQLAELAGQPLIAVDLLGFGKSAKPQDQSYDLDGHTRRLIDILDSKRIEACYVVGCSLGGALALWLASQQPRRFEKVIAISPAAINSVAPFPLAAYGSLSVAGQKVISRPIIRIALQGGLVHHHKITDEIVETYLSPFKEPGAMACFFKSIATLKDLRIYEALKTITQPVLILRGHGDRVINRRVIQKIKDANSQFSILEHPVGGHHLMEDEPEWVTSQIQAFFELNL